jgi:hypothetical protein
MCDKIDEILSVFYENVYNYIGYPNNKWDTYSQIQYPWFTDKTKVWIIGLEQNGWGSPKCGIDLKNCDIESLKELTHEFVTNDSQNFTKGQSFFNLYYKMINQDKDNLERLGYWNYYPFGKVTGTGYPPYNASYLLFDKCNWKEVFWNVIKATKPELVVFCGYYIRNWILTENLAEGNLNKLGAEITFNDIRLINIDHPSNRNKNIELEKKTIEIVKSIILP